MKKLGKRLLTTFVILWIAVAIFLIANSAGPFFAQTKNPPVEYTELKSEAVVKNRAVYGNCYLVYDLIGTSVSSSDSGEETTDSYYWAVPCDDSTMMLVRTSAGDEITATMDKLVDAWWSSETTEEYLKDNPDGVYLNGVFKPNESEMVGFYEDWLDELEMDKNTDGLKLVPCTLDCRTSLEAFRLEFIVGCAMLIIFLIVLAIIIAVIAKQSSKPMLQSSGAQNATYTIPQGGAYNADQPAAAPSPLTLEKTDEAPKAALTLDKQD